jgi:PAS domain S-box-containing protein
MNIGIATMHERPPLAQLLDAVSESVVLFDRAWRYAYANASALRHIGASREQVTGVVVWDLFPKARDTEVGRACLRVAETGVAEHVEWFHDPTSTYFASEIYRTPSGVAIVARDVTAEKMAADRIQRCAERLALLEKSTARLGEREAQLARNLEWAHAELAATWDNAPVGLNLLDRDLRYRRVNRVCAEINGLPIEAHIGKTVSEVLPEQLARELEPKLRRVLASGEVFDEALSAETLARPGQLRDWQALYFPVRDAAGGIVGVATTVREITAEREAERQKLRQGARDSAFVQATSLVLWVTDASGVFTKSSPSWSAFTGMSREALTAPWGWIAAVHPDDRERARAAWSRATQTRSVYECELRVRRHDGAYIWTLARGAPVFDARGEVVEWMGVITDIGDRKRADEQRDATLRFAEQFIGILGHDLRNPINAIQIAAQLMERSPGDVPYTLRLAQRVVSSARRMSNMVAQLLDLTRVRLGTGLKVERKAINLSDVVMAGIDELRLVHSTRTIACSCETVVEGSWDPDRLAQVVSNLVGNALQHGDPGRPVEVRLASDEPRAVVFEVHNYGEVIPSDLLPHLFDPYREERAHGAKVQGLGLGLFITHQIVRAHGGRVEVRSTAAEGTRFIVKLPRG